MTIILLAQDLSNNLINESMRLHFLAGLVVVLLLLVILLALRLSATQRPDDSHENPNDTRPVIPPLEEDDETAPEASPNAWASSPKNAKVNLDKNSNTPQIQDFLETGELAGESTKTGRLTTMMIESLEEDNPEEATVLWGSMGRWHRAATLYTTLGKLVEAGKIYVAIDRRDLAIPLFEKAFQKNPGDETTRLHLVDALFNSGKPTEAEKLILPLLEEDSPIKASPEMLGHIGRIYESMSDLTTARKYLQKALAAGSTFPNLEQKLNYLKHLERLSKPHEESDGHSPASEFLDQALRDSRIAPIPRDLTKDSTPKTEGLELPKARDSGKSQEKDSVRNLFGHEIIVGHLAFGFSKTEPENPLGSVFSLSRRFHVQQLMKESELGATFEATDRLLDYPVALKLVRLAPDTPNFHIIRQRFRAIAQLNHPNLAKLTFVDREGPMLRIATEFLSGGNLSEFLTKIGGAGVPLVIRLSMYLASALYSSHMRGVPHGDIRPENILIGPDQRIKLIDFAISPIPVQRFDEELNSIGESTETPQMLELMAKNEGIQSDLYQFGDIIEFMLKNLREQRTPPPNMDPDFDPKGELTEVANRLHNGQFSSVLRLWQVLEQIFQRAVPPKTAKTHETP